MTQADDNRREERRWIYNQRTGQLRAPDGRIAATGYSGAPGYVNDPASEALKGRGPIPKGRYRIGEPFTSRATGPHSIPLQPEGHDAHGRTAFQIHGDNARRPPRSSSRGCPIFGRGIREAITHSRAQGARAFDVVDEPEWRTRMANPSGKPDPSGLPGLPGKE